MKDRYDSYHTMLEKSVGNFKELGFSILGEGCKEILINDELYDEYVSSLSEGLEGNLLETFTDLATNTRANMLEESLNGFSPITSLSLPMQRKLIPKLIVNQAFPVEVAKSPDFDVKFTRNYIVNTEGKKLYFPEAADMDAEGDFLNRKTIFPGVIAIGVSAETDTTIDGAGGVFAKRTNAATQVVENWINPDAVDPTDPTEQSILSLKRGDFIDLDVALTHISAADAGTGADEIFDVSGFALKMELRGLDIKGKVSWEDSTGTTHSDTVFITIDRERGLVSGGSIRGLIKGVKLRGYTATDKNNYAETIGFEITNRNIIIPTAAHLAAPLSNEDLTDMLKMYSIEGTSKFLEIMTQALSVKVDKEGYQMLVDDITNRMPTNWSRDFDLIVPSRFTGTNADWKRELRVVVDHLAQTMVNDTRITGHGYFVLMGNPLDVQVFDNVEWVFDGNRNELGGVRLGGVRIGRVSGIYNYEIVSSKTFPTGKIIMMWVSSNPEEKSYVFYPYSFMVTKPGDGYSDPNNINIPAIVTTRRYRYESFFKSGACGVINILNNTGTAY